MFKPVILFVLLLVAHVFTSPLSQQTFFNVMALEEPCVRQGGTCMMKTECAPDDITSQHNLCPQQSHLGVVCCYM